jgi:serine protease Do
MKRHLKQILGLSAFAAACMALGMGLSYRWVAKAQEDRPVVVDAKNMDRMPPIAEVADKLNPTVVAITNTSFVKSKRSASPFSPFGNDEFFDWFFGPQGPQKPQPKNPQGGEDDVQRIQAGGSGVIISADGEILTNFHVVDGLRGGEVSLQVKTADGKTYPAKVVQKDKELDIALIKIEATHLPFASLGDSDAMKVGEWVVAIGNPLGLEHTVTQGIISAKGRKLGGAGLESFLQTDAAINRGNSGGPLLNLRGEVIGINTAINPEGQNLGFAVPINMVKRILPDLRAGKTVSRGYLGISPVELDEDFQKTLGVKEGVVVGDVQRDKPAFKGGVQRLDVITRVDGEKVLTPENLVAVISNHRAGDKVKISVVRDGKPIELSIVLGDRKEIPADENQNDQTTPAPNDEAPDSKKIDLEKSYGFTVEALTPANRHQFNIAEDRKGVVVTYVSPRSAAADKGLTPGLVISAVGTADVQSLADFSTQVKKFSGKPLLLMVHSPRGQGEITLAIPYK